MEDFKDLKDCKRHLVKLSGFRNGKDLLRFINAIYPGWVHDIGDSFETDLLPLTENWRQVCKRVNVKPQYIILVRKVVFENDKDAETYRTLILAQNRLTSLGYCVRGFKEFIMCLTEGCHRVMICKETRNALYKNQKCDRPFTNLCGDCLATGKK